MIRSNRNHSWAKVIPSPSEPTRCERGTRTPRKATTGWWSGMLCVYAGFRTTSTPGDGRSTTSSTCPPACGPSVSTAWTKQYCARL